MIRNFRSHAAPALLAALLAFASPAAAGAKIRIVASVTDLASIASAVGGDQVEVNAVARPNLDPHRVEVLPSYMVRVSRAKLYLKVGLGLDQWADQIIDGSHNPDVTVVDCSAGITPLEVPTGRVDARMGDVHPNGNPHYWLNPVNGGIVAHTIADALSKADPAHAADFEKRADAFAERCASKLEEGKAAVAAMPVREILTYHKSWTYLADAFGFEVASNVEPVPGIPPTARHLQNLVALVKDHHLSILIQEPYFSDDAGDFLEREAGIAVHRISPSCADEKPESYFEHFDELIHVFNHNGQAG